MSEYTFISIQKFLEDQRNYKLPQFIYNALNKGFLEVRGTELDKKLYKIYYRKYKGQINKTKILKEIIPGMILKNENGQPIIKGKKYNTRAIINALNLDYKSIPEPATEIKREEKSETEVKEVFKEKEATKKRGRPRKNPENLKTNEPKKKGRARKNPENLKTNEPKKKGRPRKNPPKPLVVKLKPQLETPYKFEEVVVPLEKKKRGRPRKNDTI